MIALTFNHSILYCGNITFDWHPLPQECSCGIEQFLGMVTCNTVSCICVSWSLSYSTLLHSGLLPHLQSLCSTHSRALCSWVPLGGSCQTFVVTGETTVIITICTWCWPVFHDILLCAERHLTSDWGQPASSFYPGFCTWTDMLLYQTTGKCLYFSMLNLISHYHFLIDIHTLMLIRETRNYEQ